MGSEFERRSSMCAGARRLIVVSSTASDSHTWSLVYLQLLLEEHGHRVVNLGACVPVGLLVQECVAGRPDLAVLSSVNGHGFRDGLLAAEEFRREPRLAGTPLVIGGKLGLGGVDQGRTPALLAAGFDAVFEDGAEAVRLLRSFIDALPAVGSLRESAVSG